MSKYTRFQIVGPALVFAAVLIAEAASFALSRLPTSEFLWWVNLEFFGIFQQSYYLLGPLNTVPFSQFFVIALPLMAMAVYGVMTRRELALAISSNLSLVYAAFLILAGICTQPHASVATVGGIAVPVGPSSYIPIVLVGVSLLSATIAHFKYLRQIRAR